MEEEDVYVISAWYVEEETTHFIFNREINYAPIFGINEDLLTLLE